MRPMLSSSSSSRSSVSPALIIAGLVLIAIVGGLVALGSTTPAPTVTPYEKTVDVAH